MIPLVFKTDRSSLYPKYSQSGWQVWTLVNRPERYFNGYPFPSVSLPPKSSPILVNVWKNLSRDTIENEARCIVYRPSRPFSVIRRFLCKRIRYADRHEENRNGLWSSRGMTRRFPRVYPCGHHGFSTAARFDPRNVRVCRLWHTGRANVNSRIRTYVDVTWAHLVLKQWLLSRKRNVADRKQRQGGGLSWSIDASRERLTLAFSSFLYFFFFFFAANVCRTLDILLAYW